MRKKYQELEEAIRVQFEEMSEKDMWFNEKDYDNCLEYRSDITGMVHQSFVTKIEKGKLFIMFEDCEDSIKLSDLASTEDRINLLELMQESYQQEAHTIDLETLITKKLSDKGGWVELNYGNINIVTRCNYLEGGMLGKVMAMSSCIRVWEKPIMDIFTERLKKYTYFLCTGDNTEEGYEFNQTLSISAYG